MINFFKIYKLIFVFLCFSLFSYSKDEPKKSNEIKITSWKFLGKKAAISGTNISITLPFGTDVKYIIAEVKKSSNTKIKPKPTTPQDYTKPLNFVVTTENEKTKKTYTVTVNIEDPIISWRAGWRNDGAYTANIDHKANKIKIDVNSADFETKVTLLDGVSINPDPSTVNNWVNEVCFTVSKGVITKTYKVKVTVNGKDIIKVTDSSIKVIINTQINKLSNKGDFNHIDVSSVNDMSALFHNKKSFNGDITKWDVSNVKNMGSMFQEAHSFNQDIGGWNVENVTNMAAMFTGVKSFNQNIGGWNVSKVNNMGSMFQCAVEFNQDIGGWNVSKVTDMRFMFHNARIFNQNISSWIVEEIQKNNCINFSLCANAFKNNYKPDFTLNDDEKKDCFPLSCNNDESKCNK